MRGASSFTTVRTGEIVVCPYTDPAWTPLFTIAAGVVTETGGALSHAAIIAREYGIPAVLGVAGTTTHIDNGAWIAQSLTARFATPPQGDNDVHEVVITHAYPIAWLIRYALAAPAVSWLGLSSANAALTVIENRPELPPSIVMFNDMSHLRLDLRWTGLRWTGFPKTLRP